MITHIISDMGGVLVALEWSERVSGLLGRSVPIDELHHLWINARSTVDFESGRIDFDTFAQNFIQEFDLQISPEQVQHEFLEFVQAPMPGCDEILEELKQQYHLSLLSNTNPAHYERLRDRYDFYAPFEQVFLSHEIGVMKPDPAIFHHVLAKLEIAPENAAFFDDGARNVTAAQTVGIHAYQVHSPQELGAIVETFETPALNP
ncbi:HAD family hydrolase [Leptolyngbya iicbica]|uniref:HAD family phosphatase n=2 Tax=Cyanophyceae TaxID=3028117 RepID=A0A4Q7E3X1_9CYAN|nr:HAD family phosphatase [Leptolyngbya sp. LK]RZM76054.1 HAD family phosphatase [Leptolyngbya sp. LK]